MRNCTDILFAAQATVPRSREDRERVVDWLLETARRHPARRVVVALNGAPGDSVEHPYDQLLADRADVPANLIVSGASLFSHLERAAGLVTVSSTAAIQAIAVGVPVIALDDFGVSLQMRNSVFEGSGLLAGSDAMCAATFGTPLEAWLDENYFHAPTEESWVVRIEAAAARRELAPLALRRQFRGRLSLRSTRARLASAVASIHTL